MGAVVLAGGRSSRMGQPKALLDWRGRPAVVHVVEIVREGVGGGPVCVVRAPGQQLPALDVIVADDSVEHGGPLVGLQAGLLALGESVDAVFACAVDTPLLQPAFVRAVCRALADHDDAVVPVIGGQAQPLLAAYRAAIAPALGALLESGARGLKDISRVCSVRELSESELLEDAELVAADPLLRSAANANTQEEWDALLAEPRRQA